MKGHGLFSMIWIYRSLYQYLAAPTRGSYLLCLPVSLMLTLWSFMSVVIGSKILLSAVEFCWVCVGCIFVSQGLLGFVGAACIMSTKHTFKIAFSIFILELFQFLLRCTCCVIAIGWSFYGPWTMEDGWSEQFDERMTAIFGERIQQLVGLYYDLPGSILLTLVITYFIFHLSQGSLELCRSFFRIVDVGGSGWEREPAEALLGVGECGPLTTFLDLLAPYTKILLTTTAASRAEDYGCAALANDTTSLLKSNANNVNPTDFYLLDPQDASIMRSQAHQQLTGPMMFSNDSPEVVTPSVPEETTAAIQKLLESLKNDQSTSAIPLHQQPLDPEMFLDQIVKHTHSEEV